MLRYLEPEIHLGNEKTLGSVSDLEGVEWFKQMAYFWRMLFQLSESLFIKFDLAIRGSTQLSKGGGGE